MGDFEIGNLAYLGVLGAMLVFWFITNHRQSFGKTLQQGFAWVLIFLGVIAAVGMWDDIRSAALPRQAVLTDQGRIEIPMSFDGHYYVDAALNGTEVRFVIDTGASDMVLSQDDAAKIGLAPDDLNYIGRAMTANGEVRTAMITLGSVELGPHSDRNIKARVTEGDMDISLLGMSYLNRYEQIIISQGKLTLER